MANTHTLDTEATQKSGASAGSEIKTKASELMDSAKEKTQDLGRSAREKIDQQREGAADALENAAGKMHQSAETTGDKISGAVHTAAEGVQSTATYLREHDTQRMISDLENVVRSNPGRSLLIAAGVGFLLGRAFRSE